MNKKFYIASFIMMIPAYSFTMLPHQLAFVRALPKAFGLGSVAGYFAHKNKDKDNKIFESFAKQDADKHIASADSKEKPASEIIGLTDEQKRNILIGLAITATSATLALISSYFG